MNPSNHPSIARAARIHDRRIHFAAWLGLVACMVFGAPQDARSVAFTATPDENLELGIAIGALFGALDAGVILGFVPVYPVSLIGELIEIETNIALKLTPPIFEAPPDRNIMPDGCGIEFTLPQTRDDYEEWFGFIEIDPLTTDWGMLGSPSVFHQNTQVVVGVTGSGLQPGLVTLNEGVHEFEWVAGSQYSILFDSVVPNVLLFSSLLSEIKYASAVAAKAAGASARRAGRLRRGVTEAFGGAFENAGLRAIEYRVDEDNDGGIFSTFTTAENRATQTITVFDTHSPVLAGPAGPGTPIEATDLGGVRFSRAQQDLQSRFQATDFCNKSVTLRSNAPQILPVGTTQILWTGRDGGLYAPGVPDFDSYLQAVVVVDTVPPLLMPPDGQVHELPLGVDSLSLSSIDLGLARVIDVADPEPLVVHEGPPVLPVGMRHRIRWTATDASNNTSSRPQWLTVKREGTNTTPTALPTQGTTETAVPIDLRLEGIDVDALLTTLPGEGGQSDVSVELVDPLGFEIVDRPDHGEFIGPLRPVFIEDFRLTPLGETEIEGVRTSPLGALAEAFQQVAPGARDAWVQNVGCPAFDGAFPVDMVHLPTYVHVTDEGEYLVRDQFYSCVEEDPGFEARREARISRWSDEREFLGHARLDDAYDRAELALGTHRDVFSADRNGDFWWIADELSFGGTSFTVHRLSSDFSEFDEPVFFGIGEQEGLATGRFLRQAHAEGELLYVHDTRGVFVVDRRDNELLGRLKVEGEEFFIPRLGGFFGVPCATPQVPGDIGDFLATDSSGALYVSDECGARIHKFEASRLTPNGEFEPGDYVGWMGRCSANVPPFSSCDEDLGVSKGFRCTDSICLRDQGRAGDQPGQFASPGHINFDPNDQLYVADTQNFRVQRFGVDGTFSGQARSTGTGINQGDASGFVLGNFGPPRAVSVNSTSFFVLESTPEQGDFFLHSFDGLPFRPIEVAVGSREDVDRDGFEDNAVLVRYVPRFDFPNSLGATTAVDTFSYRVSDGLADSSPATVSIAVDRSFRPPERLTIRCYDPSGGADTPCILDEDRTIEVELEARDPDGIVGFGGLDTLDYEFVELPENGTLELISSNAGLARYRFTPDRDYNGLQTLRYRVSDGEFEVNSESLSLTVLPVNDDPVFRMTQATASRGFGSQIRVEISDVDADPSERLPDNIEFLWGTSIVETPGELVELPSGEFEMTGPIITMIDAGRHQVQAAPVFPNAATEALAVRWSYVPDGIHDGAERVVSLGNVAVVETSQLGLSIEPDRHDPASGEFVTFEVVANNPVPEGWAGYTAQDLRLVLQLPADISPPAVSSPCSPAGPRRIECTLDSLAPGEEMRWSFPSRIVPEGFAPVEIVHASVRATDPGGEREVMVMAMLLPVRTDTDADGLPDEWERAFGLNVGSDDSQRDPDIDGLANTDEYLAGTNPLLADTDGDGLGDTREVESLRTDPTSADSDEDGLLDGYEVANGFDPRRDDAGSDPDDDGVSNRIEQRNGTDPRFADSDGDGIDDGLELVAQGFVAVTGGFTSVRFDPLALEAAQLTVESTSVEVEVPGALGEQSIAFPINDRDWTGPGVATTFLYSPDDFFGSLGGAVGHVGLVNGRDGFGQSAKVGDFALHFDPARVGGNRSGFFLESLTGIEGPSFDLSSTGTASASAEGVVFDTRLLLASELAIELGQLAAAGSDVGDILVQAVPEPCTPLLGIAALGVVGALRRYRSGVRVRMR